MANVAASPVHALARLQSATLTAMSSQRENRSASQPNTGAMTM